MQRLFWLLVVTAGLAAACADSGSGDGGGGAGGGFIDGPPTWAAIYTDYFAPTGAASCGGDTAGCHSTAADAGVIVSNLVCTDSDTCYETLTGTSKLVQPADVSNPSGAKLFNFLRTPSGTGKMPKDSSFVFHAGDIKRIQDWIQNGAQKD
ncbi:MAG: hypothetical protein U0271_23250 [Polyangiaceae bacterium]